MDSIGSLSNRLSLEHNIKQVANDVCDSRLPSKSREKYLKSYENFILWKNGKQVKSFSERVFLAYFSELSKKMKPSTLWALYSMLKSTVHKKHNVNIQEYTKLRALLKQLSHGFVSRKSNTLTAQHVKMFLKEAPDDKYLVLKVALIFGINGACKTAEFVKITVDDIEIHDEMLLIRIKNTYTNRHRIFVIRDEFMKMVQKYQALRPENVTTKRFFLNYRNGTCTNQVIGINTFASIPKQIASYLKLKNPQSYTGHCFRRTSETLHAGTCANLTTLSAWKSDQVAKGESEENKCNNLHQPTSPHLSTYHEDFDINLNQDSSASYGDKFKSTSQQCVSTSSQAMNHKLAEVYLEEQAEMLYLDECSRGSNSDEDNKPILALRESIKNDASIDSTCDKSKKNKTNELALFGQLVACKIEKLSNRTRLIAQNKINNILYDLEMQENTEP